VSEKGCDEVIRRVIFSPLRRALHACPNPERALGPGGRGTAQGRSGRAAFWHATSGIDRPARLLLCLPLPVTLVAWCARHADAPPTAVVPSLRAFLRLSFSLSLQFVNRKGAAMGRPGPGA
jgi:hypothetical protein